MTRDDFDAAAAALIRRNWRHMDDLGGQPPAALLDGLWALAGQCAAEAERDNLREWREGAAVQPPNLDFTPNAVPVPAHEITTPAKPAPRRTTRRSTPK